MLKNFLNKLRSGGTDIVNRTVKYGHNRDFLEGVCAAIALVAAAEGGVSEEEIVAGKEAMSNNPALTGAFSSREIDACLDDMFRRSKGMSGQISLLRELGDVRDRVTKDPNLSHMGDDVFCMAFDVASADGSVGPQEKIMLQKIADKLKVNLKDLGISLT